MNRNPKDMVHPRGYSMELVRSVSVYIKLRLAAIIVCFKSICVLGIATPVPNPVRMEMRCLETCQGLRVKEGLPPWLEDNSFEPFWHSIHVDKHASMWTFCVGG